MSQALGLEVEGRPGGPLFTVTYRLRDRATGAWALVDPTYQTGEVWRDVLRGGPPAAVYLTHAHFDHAAGLAELQQRWPEMPVWVHPDGLEMLQSREKSGANWAALHFDPARATHTYAEGDTVELGATRLQVIDAPGHCPGSVVLYGDGQLIAGDVLFQGGVGRWDIPGADPLVLTQTIREKIMTLPDETVVYPGHGPATTIGEERARNFIVRQMLEGQAIG